MNPCSECGGRLTLFSYRTGDINDSRTFCSLACSVKADRS